MNNNQTNNNQVNLSAVNLLLRVDSYKHSHPWQQPANTKGRFSYGSPRSSKINKISAVSFIGLQGIIKEAFMHVPTRADVAYAKDIITRHGEPFAEDAFNMVADLGFWPITIRAVREGTELPVGNVAYTVEANYPGLEWLDGFVETELLRVWYPSTVGTISKACKKIIKQFLDETSDNADAELLFKLHDFGARAVSSNQSAGIGGFAHLTNFMGTDTLAALEYARKYYHADIAGYSIPASEHGSITSWGMTDEAEAAAFSNMIKQFGRKGSIFACVSDGRDIHHACEFVWGEVLKQQVIDSEATLVIRPDSGDPISTVLQVVKTLAEKFGYTTNSKGYKVLKHVRVIQGDGVDLDSIQSILIALKLNQFSTENVAFGMGGALLQKVDRDIFGWAQKCSAIKIGDTWNDVYKNAPGKVSLRGRLALVKGVLKELNHGIYGDKHSFLTVTEDYAKALGLENYLELVFKDGTLYRDQTLDEIRTLAAI
jgi:nicotinamide phosphoribosyltransferase